MPMSKEAKFCNDAANAIIKEALRTESNPRNVLHAVEIALHNKLRAAEVSDAHREGHMFDAMRYALMISPDVTDVNCRCFVEETSNLPNTMPPASIPQKKRAVFVEGKWDAPTVPLTVFEPKQIIYSGNRTIVMWEDGTKTVVKCAKGQEYDEYSGFVAALAKKIFGTTNHVKKVIDSIKFVQPEKVKKPKNSDEAEE